MNLTIHTGTVHRRIRPEQIASSMASRGDILAIFLRQWHEQRRGAPLRAPVVCHKYRARSTGRREDHRTSRQHASFRCRCQGCPIKRHCHLRSSSAGSRSLRSSRERLVVKSHTGRSSLASWLWTMSQGCPPNWGHSWQSSTSGQPRTWKWHLSPARTTNRRRQRSRNRCSSQRMGRRRTRRERRQWRQRERRWQLGRSSSFSIKNFNILVNKSTNRSL